MPQGYAIKTPRRTNHKQPTRLQTVANHFLPLLQPPIKASFQRQTGQGGTASNKLWTCLIGLILSLDSYGVRRGKRKRRWLPGSKAQTGAVPAGVGPLLSRAASGGGGRSGGSRLRSLSLTRSDFTWAFLFPVWVRKSARVGLRPGADRGRLGNQTGVSARLRVNNILF